MITENLKQEHFEMLTTLEGGRPGMPLGNGRFVNNEHDTEWARNVNFLQILITSETEQIGLETREFSFGRILVPNIFKHGPVEINFELEWQRYKADVATLDVPSTREVFEKDMELIAPLAVARIQARDAIADQGRVASFDLQRLA